jgi:Uma2 family endonuclease
VSSSNFRADLRTKVAAYAEAEIPVYVIVDREHRRLHLRRP